MKTNSAQFRFYEELNDFLPLAKRKKTFVYNFDGNPGIKDAIQSLGVPHTEIDLILVNNKSKSFSYQLKNNDRVAVYPVFESLDISKVTHLRRKPLRNPKFILDVHLGKLAKYLRLLGFDTLYRNDYSDAEIIALAKQKKRIILTRDIGLLKNSRIIRGYWVRSIKPELQIAEILDRFDLYNKANPFARCLECNGKIERIRKRVVMGKLPEKTQKFFQEFFRCRICKKVYWEGSHYQKLQIFVRNLMKQKFNNNHVLSLRA
jgi:uncharacterized protein with PIN domain